MKSRLLTDPDTGQVGVCCSTSTPSSSQAVDGSHRSYWSHASSCARARSCAVVGLVFMSSALFVGCGSALSRSDPQSDLHGPAEEAAFKQHLQEQLATLGEPCASQAWLSKWFDSAEGARARVVATTRREQALLCEQTTSQHRAALEAAPCSRSGVIELLELEDPTGTRSKPPKPEQVEARFVRCVKARLGECQLATDQGIDHGIGTCSAIGWPEAPDDMKQSDLAGIGWCLQRVKGEQDAIRGCILATEPNPEETRAREERLKARATCMMAKTSTQTSCPLIDVTGAWSNFRKEIKFEETFEEARLATCAEDMRQVADAVRANDSQRAEKVLVDVDAFCVDDDRTKIVQLRDQVSRLRVLVIPGWEDLKVGQPPPADVSRTCKRSSDPWMAENKFIECKTCRASQRVFPCVDVVVLDSNVHTISVVLPYEAEKLAVIVKSLLTAWGDATSASPPDAPDYAFHASCWVRAEIKAIVSEARYEDDPTRPGYARKRQRPYRVLLVGGASALGADRCP